MTYLLILEKTSELLNLPIDLVDKTYKAYWLFIKDTILSLPLKEDLSEELFNTLRTNFNIPSIGKLYCVFDRYRNIKKRFEYIKIIKSRNAKSKKD